MRETASWLVSTSQRPSDAKIMTSSCEVSFSSRTSGVATCADFLVPVTLPYIVKVEKETIPLLPAALQHMHGDCTVPNFVYPLARLQGKRSESTRVIQDAGIHTMSLVECVRCLI